MGNKELRNQLSLIIVENIETGEVESIQHGDDVVAISDLYENTTKTTDFKKTQQPFQSKSNNT